MMVEGREQRTHFSATLHRHINPSLMGRVCGWDKKDEGFEGRDWVKNIEANAPHSKDTPAKTFNNISRHKGGKSSIEGGSYQARRLQPLGRGGGARTRGTENEGIVCVAISQLTGLMPGEARQGQGKRGRVQFQPLQGEPKACKKTKVTRRIYGNICIGPGRKMGLTQLRRGHKKRELGGPRTKFRKAVGPWGLKPLAR